MKPRRSAFTLVELLVAVAAAAVLISGLLTVTVAALRVWSRSQARLATATQARWVLDRIEQDLGSVLVSTEPGISLAATILPDTGLSGWWEPAAQGRPDNGESWREDAPVIGDARFGVAGTWLRLLAVTGGDDGLAVRAVGYQLIRREVTSGGPPAYQLHRAEVGAAQTFEAGYDLHPVSGGYTARSAVAGHAGNLIRPSLNQVVADHVVDFGLHAEVADGDGWRRVFPTGARHEWLVQGGDEEFPAVLVVLIRILDQEGIKRLYAFENGVAELAAEGGWWDIVEQHSHVYVRRVPVGRVTP